MTRTKISGNLTTAMTMAAEAEPSTSNCDSPALSCQSTPGNSEFLSPEDNYQESSTAELGNSQIPKVTRKRLKYITENEREKFICIEREKVEMEKQRLQLLIQDNKKREREENDSDRLFLLSLLPCFKKIPEREKSSVKIKFQRILYETIYGSSDDSNI